MKPLIKLPVTVPFGLLLLLSCALFTPNCCQGQSLSNLQLDLANVDKDSNDDLSPDRTASYIDLSVLEKRVDQNEIKIEELDQRLEAFEARPASVGKQGQAATSGWCNNPISCPLTERRPVQARRLPLSVSFAAPIQTTWPATSVTTFESSNWCQNCNPILQSTEVLPLPASLPMATVVEVTPSVMVAESINRPMLEPSRERTVTTKRSVNTKGSLIGRLLRGRNTQRSRTFSSQTQPLSSSCRVVNGVRICN